MKTWQKAVAWGCVIELALLLGSSMLLMASIGPLGPEGLKAQSSEILQFPGCQIVEKMQIPSFLLAVLVMAVINAATWSAGAFFYFCIAGKKSQTS